MTLSSLDVHGSQRMISYLTFLWHHQQQVDISGSDMYISRRWITWITMQDADIISLWSMLVIPRLQRIG